MNFLLQKGFSLIEVLIAITLIAVALLGLDAMQLFALRQQRHLYWMTVANNQLAVMTEFLQLPLSNTIRQQRFAAWNRQTHTVLPQGRGRWDGERVMVLWGRATWPACQTTVEVDSGCLHA